VPTRSIDHPSPAPMLTLASFICLRSRDYMKNVHATSIILLVAFGTACGGSSGGSIAGLISATDVGGNWVITNSGSNNSSNYTLHVFLVTGNCTATGPDAGLYPTAGGGEEIIATPDEGCFIADSVTEEGTISGTGSFIYPPQVILVGVRSPPNSPSELQLALIEAAQGAIQNDQFAVFDGTGTTTNSTMTGTWSCDVNFPACSGMSGTFSGTKQ